MFIVGSEFLDVDCSSGWQFIHEHPKENSRGGKQAPKTPIESLGKGRVGREKYYQPDQSTKNANACNY